MGKPNQRVVLYSGGYLSEWGTVYEVACFLAWHPIADTKVVPICSASL